MSIAPTDVIEPRRRTTLVPYLLLGLLLVGLPVAVWADLRNLSESALGSQAADVNSLVSSIRSYYSRNIVGRVLANPQNVRVTEAYHDIPGAIPIPATLSLELGQVVQEQQANIQYRFVSDYPFRNRAPHPLDAFEQDALSALRRDRDQLVVDRSSSGLESRVRLISPVVLEQACVSCHNSHPDSPRRDWRVGDVRGIQEITVTRPIAAGLFSFKYLLAYFLFAAGVGTVVIVRERRHAAFERRTSRELAEKNALLEEANRQVEAELEAARSLQAAILPQELPRHPSFAGKAAMIPAKDMAGDFYDFFPVGERHLGLVIADVSGKGVAAAFFMAISRTVMQSSARESLSAGACLARANTLICEQNPLDLFVTTFYGLLEVDTGVLTYANGGHNPPVLIRAADGAVVELPGTGGIALGVMPNLPYREDRVVLAPGDTLFFYTDGISEAMDHSGREFTEARLRKALDGANGRSVDDVLDTVSDAVGSFVNGAPQSDDITCLVLRYNGPGPGSSSPIESVWERVPSQEAPARGPVPASV